MRRRTTGSRPARLKACLIASNLHVGGGVQVAASLVDEWACLAETDAARFANLDLVCEVSPEVLDNLTHKRPAAFRVVTRSRRPNTARYLAHDVCTTYDRAFVVFGPHYFPLRAAWVASGYADVTSLYPTPVAASRPLGRAKAALRRAVSTRIARRADLLVVETQAIADRCETVLDRAPATLVVPNTINDAVRSGTDVPASLEGKLSGPETTLLLYTTRDYPHKNLEFLPLVRRCAADLGVDLRFVVTLTPEEWNARTVAFRDACLNAGSVRVDQIAALHRAVAGVFFPSLLEAASATPLEALSLGTPLFASDRDFVRTVAGRAAHYFDPEDPQDAAAVVVSVLADAGRIAEARQAGLALAREIPTAADRADLLLRALCGETAA